MFNSSRWRQGRELSNEAFAVVKANPHLYGYPVRAGVASLGVVVVLGAPAAVVAASSDSDAAGITAIVLLIVAALACAVIVARFQGGLVAAADLALRGEEGSYQQGMRDSAGHLPTLTAWGLINGTVGVVLGALQSGGGQDGLVGVALRLLGALVSLAWAAITFFVVPVIVFESLGAVPAIKRSAAILRAKWGPAVAGVVRIGLRLVVLFYLPGFLLIIAGGWIAVSGDDPASITLGALLFGAGLVLCIVGAVVKIGRAHV